MSIQSDNYNKIEVARTLRAVVSPGRKPNLGHTFIYFLVQLFFFYLTRLLSRGSFNFVNRLKIRCIELQYLETWK